MLSVTKVLTKQELVSSVTTKMTAVLVAPESGLVQEGIIKTPTHVETKLQNTSQIMERHTSKPWDLSWCNDKEYNKRSGVASKTVNGV